MQPPLTREEAALRSVTVAPVSYNIQLFLSPDADTFRSCTEIVFRCLQPGAQTFVECAATNPRSATLNGGDVVVRGDGRIDLPALAEHNILVVDADLPYSDTGFGLQRWVDPDDDAVYVSTHLQPAHASSVFACFDQPDLKAPFRLTVEAPAAWTVLSNAPGISRVLPYDVRRHAFEATPPMSTYLAAVVAGPLTSWQQTLAGGPQLGVHARRSLAGDVDAETILTQTAAGIAYFAELFGTPYPYPKHDLCFVPDFPAGAMENLGCVLASEAFVFSRAVTRAAHRRRSEMVLHELSHQWFGNLVTPTWWDDLWLNEAFATWAALEAQIAVTGFTDAWTSFSTTKKATAYEQDGLPTTHPVVGDVADTAVAEAGFDRITYAKGASTIRQLAALLGGQAFRAGLHAYVAEHSYATASTADLVRHLEAAAGRDLSGWVVAWLRSAGVTSIGADLDPSTGTDLRVRQLPPRPGGGPARPHRLMVGVFEDTGAGTVERVMQVEVELSGACRAVPLTRELARAVQEAALILPNDGDLTYCRAELDDRSLRTIVEAAGRISDSGARALCWAAAWEAVRQGRLSVLRYLQAVRTSLRTETQIEVVQRALRQVSRALLTYLDSAEADGEGWPRYGAWLIDVVEDGTTSRDVRLAAVRAVAEASLSPSGLVTIEEWLADGAAGALVLDDDLRRRLVAAITAHGSRQGLQVAAEFGCRDLFSTTASAATLEARVGSAEAKERAWQRVLEGREPAVTASALATGFVHPSQRHLLARFATRYTAELPALWSRRGEGARTVATQLFPLWSPTADTVVAVDDMLRTDLPGGLRRVVTEGRAELALGVRLQTTSRPESSR